MATAMEHMSHAMLARRGDCTPSRIEDRRDRREIKGGGRR